MTFESVTQIQHHTRLLYVSISLHFRGRCRTFYFYLTAGKLSDFADYPSYKTNMHRPEALHNIQSSAAF